MLTRVLPVTATAIHEAAELIRAGELVAFPTETVYGLGANAFDAAAVARIYEAKGRPGNDPLIVHIADTDHLADIAPGSPLIDKRRALAQKLVDAFWPGPLTLVLPRGSRVAPNVSAGLDTVALRMPSHPVALALIQAAGVPIAAPSANLFGHISPTTAQHVLDDLGGRIPLILDGGPTPVGVESTILDLSGSHPRLLRSGGVPLEALLPFAPDIEVVNRHTQGTGTDAMPAPGMLLRHYAPRARLFVVEGEDQAVRQVLAEESARFAATGLRVGLLVADEDEAALKRPLTSLHEGKRIQAGIDAAGKITIVSLGSLRDLETIARNLYNGLRDLDTSGVDVILARFYPPEGIGLALRDRLTRAAEGRIRRV